MKSISSLEQKVPMSALLDRAIGGALRWLEANQKRDGFWVGILQSNSCMEAQWVLAMHFLGIDNDPKYDGVVRSILKEQRSDGSWEVYYNAPQGDINATIECYAALRASGMDRESEPLSKARQWIFDHGGVEGVRVFTKFWLALIGEWPWQATPSLPPELIFLPSWSPFNIYQFASWARATIIPLCILSARRPVRPLPEGRRLDELFPQGRDSLLRDRSLGDLGLSWETFFTIVDRVLRKYVEFPVKPGRASASRLCAEWIIRHQDADGAWGGIQPPWIYSLMALHAEGYSLDHPVMANGLKAFDAHWSYEKDGAIYLQASESPVWDTLLSLLALFDCDQTPETSPVIQPALDWILRKQVTVPGDWQVKARGIRPGGWAFERANDSYPDVDDTAMALVVLSLLRPLLADTRAIDSALERASEWVVGLQSSNGGWAAFDRDNTLDLMAKMPFCDFGEVLDPPSVDVTAHVVEGLAYLGHGLEDPTIIRALEYIRNEQEPQGSWFGRWGVNHIYGTAAVLPALRAVGEDMSADYVRRAGEWVVTHQNPDGGWGETCASYMDDLLRGKGESTASQTGWALMALLAMDTHEYDGAIKRGLTYLIDNQRDGTWNEPQYTGTGFPVYGLGSRVSLNKAASRLDQGAELARGFMINYNLYRHYFPMMALGRARKHFRG